MRVLSTPKQQRMKFDIIQKNFDLSWKYGSKMRFLITPDLPMIKFGKILKFFVPVKIWIKIDILDHSGPGKAASWQNADILSRGENLAQNWHFWPLWTHERWKFEWRWKFGSKLRILTTLDPRRIKFGEIKKFWYFSDIFSRVVNLLVTWNREFNHPWPANDEILILVKNLAQKLTFLTIQDMRKMKVGKIQKFSIAIKIKPKNKSFDHSGHTNDEIWQNPEILSRALAILEIWLKKEIFDKA